jgi:hypothetical protein
LWVLWGTLHRTEVELVRVATFVVSTATLSVSLGDCFDCAIRHCDIFEVFLLGGVAVPRQQSHHSHQTMPAYPFSLTVTKAKPPPVSSLPGYFNQEEASRLHQPASENETWVMLFLFP